MNGNWRDPFTYLFPRDVRELIRSPKNVDNLSLLIDRYAPFIEEKGTLKTSGTVLKRFFRGPPSLRENVITEYSRYLSEYLHMLHKKAEVVNVLRTKSRLIVGLGDESVYETSIRLLRNYGMPYIPGSALKGIARYRGIEAIAEANPRRDFYETVGLINDALKTGENIEKLSGELEPASVNGVQVSVETLVNLFGRTWDKGREGCAVFFDAVVSPTAKPVAPSEARRELIKALPRKGDSISVFEFDIMNPHYGPYYQGNKSPAEWYEPKPITFLTVRENVPFVFAVGTSKVCEEGAEVAWALLRDALTRNGVGAKTALGYGRFG